MTEDRLKYLREARAITRIIQEGRLDPKDLPLLIKEGLDAESVDTWKEFEARSNSLDDLIVQLESEIANLSAIKERLNDLSKGSR